MFTLTDSLFYQHLRKERNITVKVKHILPQIGEVEGEVDPYFEFLGAGGSAGDPEEIDVLDARPGGGSDGTNRRKRKKSDEDDDYERQRREYETAESKLKDIRKEEQQILSKTIETLKQLSLIAAGFGEALADASKAISDAFFTLSPTLGSIGDALSSVARSASSVGNSFEQFVSELSKTTGNMKSVIESYISFHRQFPGGPPPEPQPPDQMAEPQGAESAAQTPTEQTPTEQPPTGPPPAGPSQATSSKQIPTTTEQPPTGPPPAGPSQATSPQQIPTPELLRRFIDTRFGRMGPPRGSILEADIQNVAGLLQTRYGRFFERIWQLGSRELGGVIGGLAQRVGRAFAAAGRIGQMATSIARIGAAAALTNPALLVLQQLLQAFLQSLQFLLKALGPLVSVLKTIFQIIERGTEMLSIWERWRIGLSRTTEALAAGSDAWNRFLDSLGKFGVTIEALSRTLDTAIGNIGVMAVQGRVSLEEWTRLMGEMGRLGIRSSQFGVVLQAALAGKIYESGGLGITPEMAENIALFQYGIEGLGETAARTATVMNVLQNQINNLSAAADEASRAVQAYNKVTGELQEHFAQAGRVIMEHLATPLENLANILGGENIGEMVKNIADAIGSFAEGFLSSFAPYIQQVAEIINDRAPMLSAFAQNIGSILGDTLGRIVKALVDIFTNPSFLAGIQGIAEGFRGLISLVAGLARILSPIVAIVGAVAAAIGGLARALGWVLNTIREGINRIGRWIGRFIGIVPREEEPQRQTEDQLTPIQRMDRAWKELRHTLVLATAGVEFAKRALEGLAREAEERSKSLDRMRRTLESLSVLFTAAGTPAIWTPLTPYFTATAMAMPGRLRELEEAYVQAATAAGRPEAPAGGTMPAVVGIRPTTPIPAEFTEYAAQRLALAWREVDMYLLRIELTTALLNREMQRSGYTIKESLLDLWQKMGEKIAAFAEQLRKIRQEMQAMVDASKAAYEATANYLARVWGSLTGAAARQLVATPEGLLGRAEEIARLRVEQTRLDITVVANTIAYLNQIFRQRIRAAQALGRFPTSIRAEEVDISRMRPLQVLQLGEQLQMPHPVMRETNEALTKYQELLRKVADVQREVFEGAAREAAAWREYAKSIMEFAAYLGDAEEVSRRGAEALAALRAEAEASLRAAAAAYAAGRLDEMRNRLRAYADAIRQIFQTQMDIVKKEMEAVARPLDLLLERLSTMGNMLEQVGAQALILPQVFNEAIPAATNYLRYLEMLAAQYRNHPILLNAIAKEMERVWGQVMGMLGRATAIMPMITLAELSRVSQMVGLEQRQVGRWVRERGRIPFAPEFTMGAAPHRPEYVLGYGYAGTGSFMGQARIGQLVMEGFRAAQTVGGAGGYEDIQRQLELQQLLNLRLRIWGGEREAMGGPMAQQIWARGELMGREEVLRAERGAARGFRRRDLLLPGIQGMEGMPRPTIEPVPEQVLERRVRLHVELANNTVNLNVVLRTPEGGQYVIPRPITITPDPQDIARRNPPTTGTQ
jgi:phage-related protein